ncbi:MAG: EAL domain-containing protein [Lachnospiraceae bacterium]|nr:EAL domain-containing protein [Lachnospiraceae bacterium]
MDRSLNKTALILDYSELHRAALRDLLQGELNIVEASSADEAINLIVSGKTGFDIVLMGITFPEKSGFEFLEFLRDNRFTDEVPVIVIAESGKDCFIERSFSLGAIDYIERPWSEKLLKRRVLTTLYLYRNRRELIRQLDRNTASTEDELDDLTGLPTKRTFYEAAYQYLFKHPEDTLCMVLIDIGHFKLFNQFYGRSTGDKYLQLIADALKLYEKQYGGLACYAGSDSFYYLCPDNEALFAAMRTRTYEELGARDIEIGFAPKFGVYRIEDRNKTVMDICDCANSALSHIQKEYSHLFAWYDPAMEQKDDEFKLIRDVESALRNNEFTFYLQPKVNMLNRRIVGAEALVRWIRPDGRIIDPSIFIPVLEKNGLIFRLDSRIWELVCAWQRACLDGGLPLLPVSINISRADIYSHDITDYILSLLKKYDLPVSALELEITEGAYISEYHALSEQIAKIKSRGFTILMDDFGRGYSSLNSLKDLDIDVLKIDTRFLNLDASTINKGVSILNSIVSLATSLNLPIIIEGVEFADQVKFLTEMGCFFAQGYYFYKPMKTDSFEELLSTPEILDISGIHVSEVEPVHIMKLSEEKMINDEMLNNILGAVAFYELTDSSVRLVKFNEQYYRMMGMNEVMSDPDFALHLKDRIAAEDWDTFLSLFPRADGNPVAGATADIGHIGPDSSLRIVRMRLYPLNKHEQANLYYCAHEDITELALRKGDAL